MTLFHQITDNNIGHLSLFLLEFVAFFINYEHVRFSYPNFLFAVPEERNIIAKDQSWKNCKAFSKRIKSDKFIPTFSKSFHTVKEIKFLYDDLEKRNLLIK